MFNPKLSVPLIVLAGLAFSVSAPTLLDAQEDLEVAKARYKSTPVVFELAKMTKSYDPSVALAAIRSLKEFSKVKSGRVSRDALQAYQELEREAMKWAKDYTNENVPDTVTMNKVDVDYQELIHLHFLQPKALAFVDSNGFTDYDLKSLDGLESLENLTIQNCKFFDGRKLETIHLPNLKILHLNGSGIQFANKITLKSFPKLKYVNLKNTKVYKNVVLELRSKLGKDVKIDFE